MTNFETEVKGKPLKSSEAIKLKMHDASKVTCPFMTLTEQLRVLLNTKQEENSSIIECQCRFEQAKENLKGSVRTNLLDEFIKMTPDCRVAPNTSRQEELKKTVHLKTEPTEIGSNENLLDLDIENSSFIYQLDKFEGMKRLSTI